MNAIIGEALVKQAEKLAATAKDGTLKLGAQTYVLTFDHREWVYQVKDQAGELVARFNTKTLANAKRMTREWFAN